MDGFIVVGEADNSKSVLDLIIVKSPDLVIIDFLSDDFDIETVMNIKRKFPKLFLLGITPLQNGNTLINALRAGIDSYIKKSCDIPEVVDAIENEETATDETSPEENKDNNTNENNEENED